MHISEKNDSRIVSFTNILGATITYNMVCQRVKSVIYTACSWWWVTAAIYLLACGDLTTYVSTFQSSINALGYVTGYTQAMTAALATIVVVFSSSGLVRSSIKITILYMLILHGISASAAAHEQVQDLFEYTQNLSATAHGHMQGLFEYTQNQSWTCFTSNVTNTTFVDHLANNCIPSSTWEFPMFPGFPEQVVDTWNNVTLGAMNYMFVTIELIKVTALDLQPHVVFLWSSFNMCLIALVLYARYPSVEERKAERFVNALLKLKDSHPVVARELTLAIKEEYYYPLIDIKK